MDRGKNSTLLGLLLGVWLFGCSPPVPASSSTQPVVPTQATPHLADNKRSDRNLGQMLPISAKAKVTGGYEIQLEVTRTPEQQSLGLMYRESLPDDRGMLFEFEPARPVSFWMKNVVIPLDMIFIHKGVIRAIAANVPPCTKDPCPTYGPSTSIDRVIELRGGRAAELGLKVGQQVEIQFLQATPGAATRSQP